jgi:hypothetical protein
MVDSSFRLTCNKSFIEGKPLKDSSLRLYVCHHKEGPVVLSYCYLQLLIRDGVVKLHKAALLVGRSHGGCCDGRSIGARHIFLMWVLGR